MNRSQFQSQITWVLVLPLIFFSPDLEAARQRIMLGVLVFLLSVMLHYMARKPTKAHAQTAR